MAERPPISHPYPAAPCLPWLLYSSETAGAPPGTSVVIMGMEYVLAPEAETPAVIGMAPMYPEMVRVPDPAIPSPAESLSPPSLFTATSTLSSIASRLTDFPAVSETGRSWAETTAAEKNATRTGIKRNGRKPEGKVRLVIIEAV